MNSSARLRGGVVAVAIAAVVLAGCSNAPSSPPPGASAVHNAADVSFVQNMLPHHQQAISMSQLAASRATSPQVKALADRIDAEQGPEITRMQGMLGAWGAPVTAPGTHDMGGMPGMGMMSEQDMGRLATASGPAFDRLYLQLMVRHHQGAIDMARTEQAQGQNPEATALANSIVSSQQSEIDEMNRLLGQS